MATADDKVEVRRADGRTVKVSRRAWDGVYRYRKGWALVNEHPDLSHKTRAELDDIAVERGLDPDDYGRKAELVAALEGSDE